MLVNAPRATRCEPALSLVTHNFSFSEAKQKVKMAGSPKKAPKKKATKKAAKGDKPKRPLSGYMKFVKGE